MSVKNMIPKNTFQGTDTGKLVIRFSLIVLVLWGCLIPSFIGEAQQGNYQVPLVGYYTVTNGPGEGMHIGASAEAIDFAASKGTLVYPSKPGKIVFASYNDGFGNLVEIQHDDGNISYYAHLSEILVTQNQQVSMDTKIGKVGNSGCVLYTPPCGYHLHFEVRNASNHWVNVRYLVNWNPGCPPCSGYSGTANGPERTSTDSNNSLFPTRTPLGQGPGTGNTPTGSLGCNVPIPLGVCFDAHGNHGPCGFKPDPVTGRQPTGNQVCQSSGKTCLYVSRDGGVACSP